MEYKGKKAVVNYNIDFGISAGYGSSLVQLHPDIEFKSVYVGDYQGSVISMGINKDKEWFYKCNSYGSCSGCDWVESIDSQEEAEEFLKNQEVLIPLGKDVNKIILYLEREVKNVWEFEEDDLKELIAFVRLKQNDK